MLSATIYISLCTMRNRARRWVKRLREPRYIVGMAAVVAYFYFAVFARFRAASVTNRRRRQSTPPAPLPDFSGAAPTFGALGLLVAAGASWLLPGTGRLLEFSPAEVQFLFSAPISRRRLLVYRLLRSQVGLLFASLVPSLAFALPAGSGMRALRTVPAVWLLLVAGRVYYSGVTLARSQLSAKSRRLRLMAWAPMALTLAAVLIAGRAVVLACLEPGLVSVPDILNRITAFTSTGMARVFLWPFRALTGPLFAATWQEYVGSFAAGAVIVAGLMLWVLASDEAFQDVTGSLLEQQEGRPAQGQAAYRVRKTDWILAPIGRPEGAFVWKSVMQALRIVDRRVIIRLFAIVTSLSILIVATNRTRGLAGALGTFAAAGAAYAIFLAPQILRLDFRQDLAHLELMKTWPVRAAAVVRGQITGPALILTAITWTMIGLALLLSASAFASTSAVWRFSVGLGAACLAPAVIFAQYTVHNALALIFPAWVPLGVHRRRGLDAIGQRLLTLGGTWLALAAMLLPGAILGGVVWLVFYRLTGPLVIVPAAILAALVMGLEVLLATEALGPAYERLDLTAVERPD